MVFPKDDKYLILNRWLVIGLIIFFQNIYVYSGPVTKETAQQVVMGFLGHQSLLKSAIYVKHSFTSTKEGIATYYAFNCEGGGWAIIAADDVATPVLAYSSIGSIDESNLNPSVRLWLEDISNQISQASKSAVISNSNAAAWQSALNNNFKINNREVTPLITSAWNQSQYYNDLCPADPNAPNGYNGHVMAGCVAIAMGQIMKYYSFPSVGIGSHTYTHQKYGTLTADFEHTSYNWNRMPNIAYASNKDLAQFIYQCGVAVDMDYEVNGSGAYDSQVTSALVNYFGYSDSVRQYFRPDADSIGNEIWIAQIKLELDNHRPVYYSGSSAVNGHAFVCDGYDNSFPTKFHFNWGWGGAYDGYYAVGALNSIAGQIDYAFNNYNAIITNIKPNVAPVIDASQIAVQITSPYDQFVIQTDEPIDVNIIVKKGFPNQVQLYIDNEYLTSYTDAPYSFSLPVKTLSRGKHVLKVLANNNLKSCADSVVFYVFNAVNSDSWKLQQVIPSKDHADIKFLSTVDANTIWASLGGTTNLFAVTRNGGSTWDTGHITNPVCDNLALSNISGTCGYSAYACFNPGQNQGGAILCTADGGKTWVHQPSADFTNSWANWVHFFDINNGICMGDSYQNEFVIYTTNNGGITWKRVGGNNIPAAKESETGLENSYDVYQSTIWFGTDKGRLFKSLDKGLTWSVSDSIFNESSNHYVRFKDCNHIFAHVAGNDNQSNTMYKTDDAGKTWSSFIADTPLANLVFIPGTTATWINCNGSTEFSMDDNATFNIVDGNISMNEVRFLSSSLGWGGGRYNADLKGAGIYKWNGSFSSVKKYRLTFHLTDDSHKVLSNVSISGNYEFLTDNSGNAIVNLTIPGNPYSFGFSKNGYVAVNEKFFIQSDTIIPITLKKLNTTNNSVTFIVKNLINVPKVGISIYCNNTVKQTDFSGKVEFTNITLGQNYFYSALKGNEYVDYGNIYVNEVNKIVQITFLADSFYQDKQIPDIIFPNPANDVIGVISANTVSSIKLFNASGQLVFEDQMDANVFQIPVFGLRNGIYLLELNGMTSKIYKVLIQHP